MELHCTLTDAELIELAGEWVTMLIATGGRAWSLPVPANPNKDVELILCEVIGRLKARNDANAQLQATNLELSKRVFKLEKGRDEQTLSFMDWMLLNSYEYSYINKGWQNDFPDGMDPNSEEPTYHTTQQLIQIYKQSK